MIYQIDNKSMPDLGIIPTRANQYFALSGMLDLPKRVGKTEHDWGTSIEPFVQAEDIKFDGRTLTLCVAMKPNKVDAYKSACVVCKTISFGYDTFNVVCRDEINVKDIGAYCVVEARFWHYDFALKPITITPSESGAFRLDNFDLNKDFGVYISKGDKMLNTAKRIDVSTTEFYTKTKYRGVRDIDLQCSMLGTDFADVYNKMNQFHAALMAPGLRVLKIGKNTVNVYFKNSITVNIVAENIVKFGLKASVV